MASRSERERNANIARSVPPSQFDLTTSHLHDRNKALLESLGVDKPLFEPKEKRHPPPATGKKRKALEEDLSSQPPQKTARAESNLDENDSESVGEDASTIRRSTRIKQKKEDVKERKLLPSEREKLKMAEPKHVSQRVHNP
jgi:hypothetical protein